jgi:large subunit ribosomal protein L6
MSRVGKKPIQIPEGVDVKIEGSKVTVKGPKGEISQEFQPEIKVKIEEGQILVSPQKEKRETQALWGLTRALIANMTKGVTDGFEKKLEIQGVGYRAEVKGEELVLYVGFSHPVTIKIPKGINIGVEKNIITVSGINKELVGQVAAVIRKKRPPEPYKGKGIRYLGEIVKRKVGKKAAGTTG